MWAVYKKELRNYFLSPIGYVAIGVFLIVFSLIFYVTNISIGAYDMGNLYYNTALLGLLVIVPLLTMRMFSEERKTGTEQLLLTSPRSITGIIFGKFFAAVTLIVITLIFSLSYYIVLCFFKAPNLLPTLAMIFGFLLVASAAIAMGMFVSSITENQVIAAIITIVALIIPSFTGLLTVIDLMNNYQKFPAGIISLSEVINLLAYAVMFILFTIIIMQRRKSVK